MTTQTNFKAHQRQARKNSFLLTLMFIIGMMVSACAYFSTTYFALGYTKTYSAPKKPEYKAPRPLTRAEKLDIGYAKAEGNEPVLPKRFTEPAPQFIEETPEERQQREEERIKISAGIAAIFLLIILMGYFFKRRQLNHYNADYIAVLFGANELPLDLTLRQEQYINVVEEMAVASGISCPNMYYTPRNKTINAFVTGGRNDSVAITVSQGALDSLTRDELQALVAHEFGHIFNRDVFLNNRITAVIHGFSALLDVMTLVPRYLFFWRSDDSSHSRFSRSDDDDGFELVQLIFYVWWLAMMAISLATILIGNLICAAISRQREWLADAHAVQYTRNNAALVGVLSKALALHNFQLPYPMNNSDINHSLFINYQKKWLATHPPLDKRIARYGRNYTRKDIQNLYQRMREDSKKHENMATENATSKEQAAVTMIEPNSMLLGNVLENVALSEQQQSQVQMVANMMPMLMLRKHQDTLINQPVDSPSEATCAVLAQFVILSNRPVEHFATEFKWSKKLEAQITKRINARQNEHPCTHIQTFLHQLPMFAKYPKKDSVTKQINLIIKADNVFNLAEMSYFLCLRQALKKAVDESVRQDQINEHEDAVALLLNVCTMLSYESFSQRANNYKLIQTNAAPTINRDYIEPTLDSNTVRKLYKGIAELASLKKVYRDNLVKAIEKNMLLDMQLSTEQSELLFALKRLLA